MSPLKFVAVGCALSAISLSSPVDASSERRLLDFTLVNATPVVVMELYISPAAGEQWGGDVLGQEIVPPGEAREIAVSRSETTCLWDIKIVDEDNKKRQWTRFNLCEASALTLKYAKGKFAATVK